MFAFNGWRTESKHEVIHVTGLMSIVSARTSRLWKIWVGVFENIFHWRRRGLFFFSGEGVWWRQQDTLRALIMCALIEKVLPSNICIKQIGPFGAFDCGFPCDKTLFYQENCSYWPGINKARQSCGWTPGQTFQNQLGTGYGQEHFDKVNETPKEDFHNHRNDAASKRMRAAKVSDKLFCFVIQMWWWPKVFLQVFP